MSLPSCRFILGAVADEFGVLVTDLLAHRRTRHVARPRMVAFWIAQKTTALSYPVLGDQFDRDHTTVMHGVAKVDVELRGNPKLRGKVLRVLQRIERMQRH